MADWQCPAGTPNAGAARMITAVQQPGSGSFRRIELDTAASQACAVAGATATTANGTLLRDGSAGGIVWNNKYKWISDGGVFGSGAYEQYRAQPADTVEVALEIANGRVIRVLSRTDTPTTTLVEQSSV